MTGPVLFVSRARFTGGSTRSLRTLLVSLAAAGLRADVAVPDSPAATFLDHGGGEVHRLGDGRTGYRDAAGLRRRRYPAVVSNSLSSLPLALLAARWRSGLVVVHRGNFPRRLRSFMRSPLFRLLPTIRFVAVSEAAADDLRQVARRTDRVAVISNAISPAEYRATERLDRTGPVRIGYLGGESTRKGWPELRRLVAEHDLDDLDVLLAGFVTVPEPGEAGSRNRVRMVGKLGDPRDVYRRIDILLAPSRHEGFGRIVIEALLNGVVVLASDIAPFRHFASACEAVTTIDFTRPEAAAAALLALADDVRRDGERLAAAATAYAEEYAPAVVADRWLSLLSEVTTDG